MKKILFAIVAVLALTLSSSAFAQRHHHGLSATSNPVQMKAIIPEYIGLDGVNTSPVIFDFGKGPDQRDTIASGYTNLMAIAPTAPSWKLTYNLRQRTVTVCAYATDLVSAEFHPKTLNKLPATFINGTSL
jgi:hypothetical protein